LPSAGAGGLFGSIPGLAKLKGGFTGKSGSQANGAAAMLGLTLAMDSFKRKGAGGTFEAIGGGAMATYGLAGQSMAKFGAAHGGVGGQAGALMGAAGVGIALDGIRRGGGKGLMETTAGGALVGFQMGGPLGAAIGAGVGFAIGTIRLFIKGRGEKLKIKVKNLYGLDIDNKMLQQLLDLSKSSFNDQDDLMIRSKQALDLLSLYAEATGQQFGLSNQVRPAYLVQSGGGLYQSASYHNGSSIGLQSSLPSLGGFDKTIGASGYNQSPMAVTLSLDGDSSSQFLQGQTVNAISANPAAVSTAASEGYATSAGRTDSVTALNSPGALVR
jgi:hypothetical protein